jgi:hypothetical protein
MWVFVSVEEKKKRASGVGRTVGSASRAKRKTLTRKKKRLADDTDSFSGKTIE